LRIRLLRKAFDFWECGKNRKLGKERREWGRRLKVNLASGVAKKLGSGSAEYLA
jgi:hypothetical protein